MGLSFASPGGSTGSRGASGALRWDLAKLKPSGQGAPSSIHFLSASTSSLPRRSPFRGIRFLGSPLRTLLMRALFALLPGSRAGPLSPPCRRFTRVFIENPPLRFSLCGIFRSAS